MAFPIFFLLFLSLIGHSSGLYCVCKDGVSDKLLQTAIDYACGAGANCNPILQNGPCFQPNTVKDHCNYAVNSYYQNKGNVQGSCDFAGAAATTQTPPNTPSGCVYPSSPGTPSSLSPPGSIPGTAGSPSFTGMGPSATGDPSGAGAGVSCMKNTSTTLLFLFVVYLVFSI